MLATGLATLALASAAHATTPNHTYHSWAAAQRAARFTLLAPTRTDGLSAGAIDVSPCEVTGLTRYRIVGTTYGNAHAQRLGLAHASGIAITEQNTPEACGNGEQYAPHGHVTVHGHRITLWALCYTNPPAPVHCAPRLGMQLSWQEGRRLIVISSHGEPLSRVLGLARSLQPVATRP